MNKSLDPHFDEHFHLRGSSADQLTVKIWDKDLIGPGDLIGQCTLPLSSLIAATNTQPQDLDDSVNSKASNERASSLSSSAPIMPQWYAVFDKENVRTGEISLALRVTAAAETSGLNTQEDKEITLTISELAGRALKAMDWGGTSDPYMTFTVGDSTEKARRVQTTVIKKSLNPEWRETLELQVSSADIAAEDLRIRVFDKDLVGADDLIGEVRVALSAVSAQEYASPRWLPILDESQAKTGDIRLQLGLPLPLPRQEEDSSEPLGGSLEAAGVTEEVAVVEHASEAMLEEASKPERAQDDAVKDTDWAQGVLNDLLTGARKDEEEEAAAAEEEVVVERQRRSQMCESRERGEGSADSLDDDATTNDEALSGEIEGRGGYEEEEGREEEGEGERPAARAIEAPAGEKPQHALARGRGWRGSAQGGSDEEMQARRVVVRLRVRRIYDRYPSEVLLDFCF